jgi:sugar lactone lactonase YvrE
VRDVPPGRDSGTSLGEDRVAYRGERGRARAIALSAVLLASSLAGARPAPAPVEPPPDPRPYAKKAQAAYDEKDYAAFRENMEKAVQLRPGHTGYQYNLAMAEALTGRKDQALYWLSRVAGVGLHYPAAEESAFETLRDSEAFRTILRQFEANKAPVHRSSIAFKVGEQRLIAEGLAYDPAEDRFLVGSVHRRKILRVRRDGKSDTLGAPEDGLWGVFGMRVDPARRLLWVASAALPEMEGYRAEDEGKTGVFKYDLRTGKLLSRYLPDDQERKHLFGDLTLDAQGNVFVTDGVSPILYAISRRSDRLESFVEGPFVSLQGVAVSGDGKRVYVTDYGRGIFAVDRASRKTTLLPAPERCVLLGIDGIYVRGDRLIGVQNGTRQNRIVRLSLDEAALKVKSLEVLEANTPELAGPTLGVRVGGDFFYISNSEWDAFDAATGRFAEDKLRQPVILKVPF